MMSEPWYEECGPSADEVRSGLLSICIKSNIKICDIKNITKIVDDTIKEEKDIGWGSYRCYYNYTRDDLVKKCNVKIEQYVREN